MARTPGPELVPNSLSIKMESRPITYQTPHGNASFPHHGAAAVNVTCKWVDLDPPVRKPLGAPAARRLRTAQGEGPVTDPPVLPGVCPPRPSGLALSAPGLSLAGGVALGLPPAMIPRCTRGPPASPSRPPASLSRVVWPLASRPLLSPAALRHRPLGPRPPARRWSGPRPPARCRSPRALGPRRPARWWSGTWPPAADGLVTPSARPYLLSSRVQDLGIMIQGSWIKDSGAPV
jgi:hypothetical protein